MNGTQGTLTDLYVKQLLIKQGCLLSASSLQGCLQLTAHCSLSLTAHCHSLSLTAHCSLTARNALLTAMSLTAHCYQTAAHCNVITVTPFSRLSGQGGILSYRPVSERQASATRPTTGTMAGSVFGGYWNCPELTLQLHLAVQRRSHGTISYRPVSELRTSQVMQEFPLEASCC